MSDIVSTDDRPTEPDMPEPAEATSEPAERRERRARIHADGACDPPHPQVPPALLEALRAAWQARRS